MNITIYTSHHCAACRVAVHFFQESGIPYHQLDVSNNKDNFKEMLSHGGIATPMIIIGTDIFHSYDQQKIKEALPLVEELAKGCVNLETICSYNYRIWKRR